MLVEEHGAEFGEPVRRILERGQDDRALVDRERQQRHVAVEGTLEPIGELVGAERPNRAGAPRPRRRALGRRRASSGEASGPAAELARLNDGPHARDDLVGMEDRGSLGDVQCARLRFGTPVPARRVLTNVVLSKTTHAAFKSRRGGRGPRCFVKRPLALVVLMLAIVGAGVAPSGARAADASCGMIITTPTTITLTQDLVCNGTAISIDFTQGGSVYNIGVSINLNGYTISGDGTGSGISIRDITGPSSRPVAVSNGTIRGFASGIWSAESQFGSVRHLNIRDNTVGIELFFGNDGWSIIDNTVAGNGVGILLKGSNGDYNIERNRIINNGTGAANGFNDYGLFKDNVVAHNAGTGLALGNNARIVGNIASGNGGDGIRLQEVTPLLYPGFFVADNVADFNGGLGINAPADNGYFVTDGGGNSAKHNGDPRECVNIYCASNPGEAREPHGDVLDHPHHGGDLHVTSSID
jgi:hypothetical protein